MIARAEMSENTRITVWLIEQPETDNMPVRWWNPATGWMRDANKATWFVRKQDAESALNGDRFLLGIVTEHIFIGTLDDRGAHND